MVGISFSSGKDLQNTKVQYKAKTAAENCCFLDANFSLNLKQISVFPAECRAGNDPLQHMAVNT